MVNSCCVKDCHNKQNRENDRRYFSIPTVVTGKGEEVKEITTHRRRAWLAQLRLKGFTFDTTARRFVCSDHFVHGRPAFLRGLSHPDWLPTLKLGHEKGQRTDSSKDSSKYSRLQNKRKEKMESHDLHMMSEVKIEIDIAEETPPSWITESHIAHDLRGTGATSVFPSEETSQAQAMSCSSSDVDVKLEGTEEHSEHDSSRDAGSADNTGVAVDVKIENESVAQSTEALQLQTTSCAYSGVCVKLEGTNEQAEHGPCLNAGFVNHKRDDVKVESGNISLVHSKKSWKPQTEPYGSSGVVVKLEETEDRSVHDPSLDASAVKIGRLETAFVKVEDGHNDTAHALSFDTGSKDSAFVVAKVESEPYQPKVYIPVHCATSGIGQEPVTKGEGVSVSKASQTPKLVEEEDGSATNTLPYRKGTVAKPYGCSKCDAVFTYFCRLKEHNVLKHTIKTSMNIIKSQVCGVCGSAFAKAFTLMIHMRLHTGERPYSCNECDATFIQNSNLTVHMRKHTGERPFSCGECDSTFTHSNSLQNHVRKHTGEKPYRCGECGAGFSQSGTLNAHMRRKKTCKPANLADRKKEKRKKSE